MKTRLEENKKNPKHPPKQKKNTKNRTQTNPPMSIKELGDLVKRETKKQFRKKLLLAYWEQKYWGTEKYSFLILLNIVFIPQL